MTQLIFESFTSQSSLANLHLMKTTLILTLLLTSLSSFALTFEVTELCEDKPHISEEIPVLTLTNVLDFTKYHLKNLAIPHTFNENGITSILDTPVGYDSYEFITNNHMRVYGWCYEVNGVQPSIVASEFMVDPESQDIIRWFYGYAEVVEGTWIHYCKPVYEMRMAFVCPVD